MKKSLYAMLAMLCLGLACSESSPSGTQEAKSVKIIYTDWSEGVAISYLVKNVLADKLDYEVIMKLDDLHNIYPAVAEGDYDLFLDAWLPVTHKSYYDKYRENLVQTGVIFTGAEAGLVVPDYAEANSLEDLAHKKPTIYGIDSSSGVVSNTIRAAEAYGFEPTIITGTESEMMSKLEDGFKRRKNIIITGWKPHKMFSQYTLKFLKDDKGIYGDEERIVSLANKDKLEKDPVLRAFLHRFELTSRQFSQLISEVLGHPDGEDAGAKSWIRKNRIIVSRWTKNLSEFEEKAL